MAPQPGPQTLFLHTTAEIALYGGAAGGGKTYALLLEGARHMANGDFGGVIFRKTSTQIRNEGGLWDEARKMYIPAGAQMREHSLDATFESGAKMKFAGLEYDNDVYNYQGSQIPFIGFDELTHFSKFQFLYMLSRNRSTSGIPSYIRATCNPDANSWVRDWVLWYIDEATGYPRPERSGKIRWFINQAGVLHWADSREELLQRFGNNEDIVPKSFTFILSKLEDNKILMEKDPGYKANLLAQNMVEQERLLRGNWNIKPAAGNFFQRGWFDIIDAVPADYQSCIRFWDRAATKPNIDNPDPDWTRGLKLYRYRDGTWVVGDVRSMRDSPGQVERFIKDTAGFDSNRVQIMAQQDPGSAGVKEAEHFIRMLQGYNVKTSPFSKDKITRSKAVSAQCQARNIKVLRGTWNEDFFTEIENFPQAKHDDQVDALSGAFNELVSGMSIFDLI
ncbi:MAG: phage terminase large subunit [Chlamydiales bacterium]